MDQVLDMKEGEMRQEMQMQMQQEPKEHSPLPWKLRDGGTGWLQITDAQGRDIIDVNYSDGADDPELFPEGANAAFLLRAVNNHDALVTNVRQMLNVFYPHACLPGAVCARCEVLVRAQRALSAAQEQSNEP